MPPRETPCYPQGQEEEGGGWRPPWPPLPWFPVWPQSWPGSVWVWAWLHQILLSSATDRSEAAPHTHTHTHTSVYESTEGAELCCVLQGLVVCQVKLSTGLMVHGPQCQSENDAKEKAALFALLRLVSSGSACLPYGI